MKQKIISILLCLSLVFVLSACGSSGEPKSVDKMIEMFSENADESFKLSAGYVEKDNTLYVLATASGLSAEDIAKYGGETWAGILGKYVGICATIHNEIVKSGDDYAFCLMLQNDDEEQLLSIVDGSIKYDCAVDD